MTDGLDSWTDGTAKTAILGFVRSVTTPGDRYVPAEARIATFDNDGTQPIDDGPGKPVHIFARTGRRPLLAGGNSDGDIAMLETARFGLLVHHDDPDREFAYDAGTERALVEARSRGSTVVSMKDDFATIF